MTAAICGFTITMTLLVLIKRQQHSGRKSAADLFLIVYAVYTGPILLEMGLRTDLSNVRFVEILDRGGFQIGRTSAAIAATSFYVGVVATVQTVGAPYRRKLNNEIELSKRTTQPTISPGRLLFITSLIAAGAIVYLASTVGISTVLASRRGDRSGYGSSIFLLYGAMMTALAIALTELGGTSDARARRRLKRYVILIAGVLAAASAVNGDRRFVGLALLIGIAETPFDWSFGGSLQKRLGRVRSLMALGSLVLVLLLFARYRWAIPELLNGSITIDQAVQTTQEAGQDRPLYYPSSHEFAGPAMSLFSIKSSTNSDLSSQFPLVGTTYIRGLLSAIPSFPPTTLGRDFADAVNGNSSGSGYGFHPAAEAAYNFSIYYAFVGGALVGLTFCAVDAMRVGKHFRAQGAVLVFMSLDLNRINFSLREASYTFALATIMIAASRPKNAGAIAGEAFTKSDEKGVAPWEPGLSPTAYDYD